MNEHIAGKLNERSADAQQRAAEWLAAARITTGSGADPVLLAALVNAMAAAYLADAVQDASGNMQDMVTYMPNLGACD